VNIIAKLRAVALSSRQALAAVADQTSTAVVTLGPFSVTLYAPKAPHQAAAVEPPKPAAGLCTPGACSRPGKCILCGLGARRP
jgi:hypothetical protein